MKRHLNPSSIVGPLGMYSHGVVAPGDGRWLHVAGQVGVRPDGSLPPTFEEQARVAWQNMLRVLEAAEMDVGHLVKISSYLIDVDDLPALARVRQTYQGLSRPASTLVVVKSLANPAHLYEVDAVAYAPGASR